MIKLECEEIKDDNDQRLFTIKFAKDDKETLYPIAFNECDLTLENFSYLIERIENVLNIIADRLNTGKE